MLAMPTLMKSRRPRIMYIALQSDVTSIDNHHEETKILSVTILCCFLDKILFQIWKEFRLLLPHIQDTEAIKGFAILNVKHLRDNHENNATESFVILSLFQCERIVAGTLIVVLTTQKASMAQLIYRNCFRVQLTLSLTEMA